MCGDYLAESRAKLPRTQRFKCAPCVRETATITSLLSSARTRARKKRLPFSIVAADLTIPERCPLLGIRLVRNTKRVQDNSPTLDRIDPRKGYVPGNVWVISSRANTIKSDAKPEEILAVGQGMMALLRRKAS